MAAVHSTKVDSWLVGVLIGALGVSAVSILAVAEADPRGALGVGFFVADIWIVAGVVVWPTQYLVGRDNLVVRSGLIRWKIPFWAIVEVFPTRNPTSSPAWSLDRLQVRYIKGGASHNLCVSPVDKEAFLADLAAADPNLHLRDGRILRRTAEGL